MKVRELFESIFRVIMILFLSVVDSNNKNSLFRTNHHRNQWKFQKTCTRGATGLPPLSQLFFFLEGGFCLVCIWKAWLNSMGGGGGEVVVKFDVFSHCYAACLFDASDDPLC